MPAPLAAKGAPTGAGGVPSAATPGAGPIPAILTGVGQDLFENVSAGAEATAGDSAAAAAAPAPKRRRISGIADRLASAMTA